MRLFWGTKARVGGECCISSRGPNGPSNTVEVYKLKESKKKVIGSCGISRISREGSSKSENCLEY